MIRNVDMSEFMYIKTTNANLNVIERLSQPSMIVLISSKRKVNCLIIILSSLLKRPASGTYETLRDLSICQRLVLLESLTIQCNYQAAYQTKQPSGLEPLTSLSKGRGKQHGHEDGNKVTIKHSRHYLTVLSYIAHLFYP